MIRLCEIIGLTYNDLSEITGYSVWLIGFGVLTGKCMYTFLEDVGGFLGLLLRGLLAFVRKHFPNVRKGR